MTATGDRPGRPADAALAQVVRREVGLIVASLHRLIGDFDVAEEAVQDALVAASAAWRSSGSRPTRARGSRWRPGERRSTGSAPARPAVEPRSPQPVAAPGPRSRRAAGASAASAPPTSGCPCSSAAATRRCPSRPGSRSCCARWSDSPRPQIARAFLVPEATLAQRLVRAKNKIGAVGIPFEIPVGRASSDPARRGADGRSTSPTTPATSTPARSAGWPMTRSGWPSCWLGRFPTKRRPGGCSPC